MLKMKSIILGLSVSLTVLALLLCALAAFMIQNGLLGSGASAAALAACSAVSVFAGSWTAAHTAGGKGLLHGLSAAGLFCILYLAAVFWLGAEHPNASFLLLRCLPALIVGPIGGILGVGEKKKISF